MKEVVDAIKAGDDFLIATHVNPDGDALGSAIALAMGLKSLGKKVSVYDRDGVPETYTFLPGQEIVLSDMTGVKAGTLILVDCNKPVRAGLSEDLKFKNTMVIDHHETDSDFGQVKWIDPAIPATGLMVFEILKSLDVALTTEMAQNIYTAIALDTGTFRYSNTTADALHAGAELIEAGASPGHVADKLYSNWGMNRFALFQAVLSNMDLCGDICFLSITRKMHKEFKTSEPDTENFVNFPLQIDSVRASVMLKELVSRKGWRVSMRSKGDINVADIAERCGGGGHRNAAGCNIEGTYEEAKGILIKELSSK